LTCSIGLDGDVEREDVGERDGVGMGEYASDMFETDKMKRY